MMLSTALTTTTLTAIKMIVSARTRDRLPGSWEYTTTTGLKTIKVARQDFRGKASLVRREIKSGFEICA